MPEPFNNATIRTFRTVNATLSLHYLPGRHMHVLKVIILLVLTLAAMRLVSWSLLWLLRRFSGSDSLYLRPASNALALCGFAGLLVLDSVPGEILDLRALVFGIFIYVIYSGLDLRWVPRLLRR